MESYYRSNQYDYDDDDEQQFQRKDCSKTCKRSVPCIACTCGGKPPTDHQLTLCSMHAQCWSLAD